jgi:hypothetical protein
VTRCRFIHRHFPATIKTLVFDALAAEHRFKEAETESLGGYQILSSKSSGPQKWIQLARQDLANEYDALHQPEQAAKFRAAAAAKP